MKVAVITVSDKGARGERIDESGSVIKEMMPQLNAEVVHYEVIPDEFDIIAQRLASLADNNLADIIFTTGGTGFSPRDVTPEATLSVIQKEAPGLAEAMRQESLKVTPHAMLSRAIAGIRGSALIVNLPGSPKAVRECLRVILPALSHGVEILKGKSTECAAGGDK